MPDKKRARRCKARTKTGKPCAAAPTTGGLCFFHGNPNKASELGRIGGRNKRPVFSEIAVPLPKLDSVIAVRDAVAQLIADVHSGKLDPRIASGLAPLINLQLRAIEATDHASRIANLEKRFEEMENPNGGNQTA